MNPNQPYMDVHSSHMSSGQPYNSQSATAGGMSHYPQYQQPPILQPGSASYAPSPSSYGHYGYSNGVTSPQAPPQSASGPMGSQVPAQLLPLPGGPLPAMNAPPAGSHPYGNGPPSQAYASQPFDTTGQVAPPGMKPRVTATLWEDEGSLCFQVEAKGVCVARREDNHMINGTKLLNVAGMTRGRRDGILKSEKVRHVVKIGPMHLKGVWIPFERALDFANKEKITEQLYPLFVHNIGGLLYHPSNQTRTNAVVQASERRRIEGSAAPRTSQGPQPPTMHHHHSMTNSVGPPMPQPPHSIAPHPGAGRPGLDRAHTFPTPPTSASSIMGMGSQSSSYEWGGQNVGSSVSGTQPLSIDTGLSNTRSMPTTPATTPPGNSMQNMQGYSGQPPYDNAKSYYSAPPPSQGQYAHQPNVTQQNMARFGPPIQAGSYVKNEMGPPSGRGPGAMSDPEHHDGKADQYSHSAGNGQTSHGPGESEAEHEHDNEYIHDNGTTYNSNRGSYTYAPGPPVGSLQADHSHVSPEMTGSPSHPNGSGRGTPRMSGGNQGQWAPGYHTPPRQAPSSNLYNVMSDARGSGPNGNSASEPYPSTNPVPSSYPSSMNGGPPSNKRMRDDDDQDHSGRPDSRGADAGFDLKRRKTIREDSVGGPVGGLAGMQSIKSGVMQRRR